MKWWNGFREPDFFGSFPVLFFQVTFCPDLRGWTDVWPAVPQLLWDLAKRLKGIDPGYPLFPTAFGGWQVSKRGFFSNLRKHPFRLQKFMQFKVTRLSFFFSSQDLETILEDYPQEKGSGPQLFHKTTEHPLWAISGCFTIWNLSGMSGTISVLNHVDVPKLRHMLEVIATMMREAELSIVFQIPDVLFLFTIVV